MRVVESGKRVELRLDHNDALDDVVVRDVSMFRAEVLSPGHLWLCCYLPGPDGEEQRITFEVHARGKRLQFETVETPDIE